MARKRLDRPSYIHDECAAGMCDDCLSIGEEYERLHNLRRDRMFILDKEKEALELEVARLQRKVADLEHMLKLGLPPLMIACIDVLGSRALREEVEKAHAKLEKEKTGGGL